MIKRQLCHYIKTVAVKQPKADMSDRDIRHCNTGAVLVVCSLRLLPARSYPLTNAPLRANASHIKNQLLASRSHYPCFRTPQEHHIYIIYTPNLGLEIAIFDREREHGRIRGSIEGTSGSTAGAPKEQRGEQRVDTKRARGLFLKSSSSSYSCLILYFINKESMACTTAAGPRLSNILG